MVDIQKTVKKTLLYLVAGCLLSTNSLIAQPKFESSWSSLAQNYKTPDWFRDAKFGIFMHWGIMAAIDENREYGGSHYGRYMYGPGEYPPGHERSIQAEKLLAWHTKRYGHPNKFGYKDFIPMFKAERWNPDSLVAFYKACGAKYIVPVAVHHDNFDMYDSQHRWNAVDMGPKKDIIQGWKEAAERQGVRFGVSTHLDRVASFFQTSRKFDGKNQKYADFYNTNYSLDYMNDEAWMKVWYSRTLELVDKYKPDLLYFDGSLPGTNKGMTYGLDLASHFYNSNIQKHNGKLEAVMNLKHGPDKRAFVWDIERGQADALQRLPWQTDTDLSGGWFYRKTEPQFNIDVLVGNLIDIVSKNGNLLLNVGLKSDGTLPDNQAQILKQLGAWLKINGEGIYASRPWLVYGEGPTKVTSGAFQEQRKPYTEQDIRFTTRDGYIYAFVLKIPAKEVNIKSLASSLTLVNKIEDIQLLGTTEKLIWKQNPDALNIQLPKNLDANYALVFKIKTDDKSKQTWELILE
jgi:alpha-L-fucosidase